MVHKKLLLKLKIPHDANVFAESGNSTEDLFLYEVDQLDVLEEVKLEGKAQKFHVKDGQFVRRGEIIFTEGFLGQKAMVSDFNGIVEIKPDVCRILGQKQHFERRIKFKGIVKRVVPRRFVVISSSVVGVPGIYFANASKKLTSLTYFESKKAFFQAHEDSTLAKNTTVFINNVVYVDDIARIIAIGVKRLIVNAVYIDGIQSFLKEASKLESFCVISGFTEQPEPKYHFSNPGMDVFWGKRHVYFTEDIRQAPIRAFEHPNWGISGSFQAKDGLVSNLEYNGQVLEFYLKNIERNE